MSEQSYKTAWQIQKELRPRIEDIAKELNSKEDYNNCIKFINFLKDNKLTPRWQSFNKWSVNYKSKLICHIGINSLMGSGSYEDGRRVSNNIFIKELLVLKNNTYITSDIMKEFIWENIKTPPCMYNIDCKGIQDIIILDKPFESICKCWPFSIKNPSEDQLVYLNKLILAFKNFITDLNNV